MDRFAGLDRFRSSDATTTFGHWMFAATGLANLDDQSVVINQSTADGVGRSGRRLGDGSIAGRAGRSGRQPAGSPRCRKRRPAADEGRRHHPRSRARAIRLSPSQAAPKNILSQSRDDRGSLGADGQANTMLFAAVDRGRATSNVDLAALGLRCGKFARSSRARMERPADVFDYYSLTSDRLLIPDAAVGSNSRAVARRSQVFALSTYLANAIERLDDRWKRDCLGALQHDDGGRLESRTAVELLDADDEVGS